MGSLQYEFFPKLARRVSYQTKKNGKFYVYSRYRIEIAEDCLHRCVYCDAKEEEVGGTSAMELDHFRPTARLEFKCLTHDPRNLHYSCRECNKWKSDLWPAAGTLQTYIGNEGFLDPFEEERRKYFAVSASGRIKGKKAPADYMIELLGLDRLFMRRLRQSRRLMGQVLALAEQIDESAKTKSARGSSVNAKKATRLLMKIAELEKRRSS